ncbi:hypothetical protein BDW74DRAFT_175225 [Aspergillus multicolor]|uniref:uncharacterized protein n=1 Tax=Aspergillus multicolor TaxID=41759 RepID=UPI003CCD8575
MAGNLTLPKGTSTPDPIDLTKDECGIKNVIDLTTGDSYDEPMGLTDDSPMDISQEFTMSGAIPASEPIPVVDSPVFYNELATAVNSARNSVDPKDREMQSPETTPASTLGNADAFVANADRPSRFPSPTQSMMAANRVASSAETTHTALALADAEPSPPVPDTIDTGSPAPIPKTTTRSRRIPVGAEYPTRVPAWGRSRAGGTSNVTISEPKIRAMKYNPRSRHPGDEYDDRLRIFSGLPNLNTSAPEVRTKTQTIPAQIQSNGCIYPDPACGSGSGW